MADKYFSLEIGESFLKAVDAKKSDNSLTITSLGNISSDPMFYNNEIEKNIENQASLINKLVNATKITKKNVAVIIPDSFTYTQVLSMPRLTEKELISAIKYQADQFIPLPIEEINIDVEVLHENEKEKTITTLIVAAPKKLIEKIQTLIEMAGLIPESVENEFSSTGRFLVEFKNLLSSSPNDKIILINLASKSTSLYFYDSYLSLIKETHNFNIGYQLFVKEIQINTNYDLNRSQEILKKFDPKQKSSYDITPIITPVLKEFFQEIKRFMTLVNEKYQFQINNIYLINEIFQFPAIAYFLEKTFNVNVKELNPYPICKTNPLVVSHKDELPLFISALGGNLR